MATPYETPAAAAPKPYGLALRFTRSAFLLQGHIFRHDPQT